ncbi:MAG: nucleotidyltransferase domain-containing protein [Candidatus Helarchaeota archaeon]
MPIYAREGDFIETNNDLIFDVKGFIHPPAHIVAYLRYYPDTLGERHRKNCRYKKVYSLDERFKILKTQFPQFIYDDPAMGQLIQAVPHRYIRKIYEPHVYLGRVLKKPKNRYEKAVARLTQYILDESGIFHSDLGVSGSPMVGLNRPDSDIDIIVYGSENARKVHDSMERLFKDEQIPIRPYNYQELQKLYKFKSQDTHVSFEDFVKFEIEKKTQGIFEEKIEFFIRNLKAWDEIEANPTNEYGYYKYRNVGEIAVQARIVNDQEAIFTPCIYGIKLMKVFDGPSNKSIERVVSYRGRFTEAKLGKIINIRGTLEIVNGKNGEEFYQIVVGARKEHYLTY